MRIVKIALLIIGIVVMNGTCLAQESMFKALFISKFAEYVQWPNDPAKIVVGLAGNSEVYDHLAKENREYMEVKEISNASESKTCNIIFVSNSSSNQITSFINSINGSSVLIVTENGDLVKEGADIGFYQEQGKLRFMIVKSSIESKKMTPSTKLLELGKVL